MNRHHVGQIRHLADHGDSVAARSERQRHEIHDLQMKLAKAQADAEKAERAFRDYAALVKRERATFKELRGLLADMASDIAEQCDATYPTRDRYPDQMRRYDRDMAVVRRARAVLDAEA